MIKSIILFALLGGITTLFDGCFTIKKSIDTAEAPLPAIEATVFHAAING